MRKDFGLHIVDLGVVKRNEGCTVVTSRYLIAKKDCVVSRAPIFIDMKLTISYA